jgi:hypothetical protein
MRVELSQLPLMERNAVMIGESLNKKIATTS